MANISLTKNAISQMLQGVDVQKPVLQVLAYKSVDPDVDAQQRVRFILSDGVHSHQCCIMVGSQNVARVERGEFERFSIIQLNSYLSNTVNNRKVIIMSEPRLIKAGSEVGTRIGSPVNFLQQQQQQQNGGDVKPSVSELPLNKAPENGGSVAQNAAVKRPNGSGRPFDGPSSSPKRGRPAGASQTVVIPINALNPFQNRWVVKGRVVSKSATRTWHNQKGEGKLFNFELKDDTGDIKITCFNQECDRFQSLVEVGKVIKVSRGQVKNANKRYTQADYEVTLSSESTVEEDHDETDCPEVEYHFVQINEIEKLAANTLVDVAGVIRKVDDAATITQKTTQKELIKRDVTIVDESEAEIKLTMWGADASNFSAHPDSVLFIRNAKISDYNGKSLNASMGSSIQIDPKHPVCDQLSGWYRAIQDNLKPKSLSGLSMGGSEPLMYLFQAHTEVMQMKGKSWAKPKYFLAKVTIGQMGRTNTYLACKICRSKMQDMNNGTFKCFKCAKETDYESRIIQSVCLSDDTTELWGTAFHDEALQLFGTSAQEVLDLKENDDNAYQDLLLTINFRTYMAKLKSQMETYKEEERVKTSILRLEPIDKIAYSRTLLDRIKALTV